MVTCNRKEVRRMANTHVNSRVQKHRDALRMSGLRPVQIWVPDTRRPDFAEECRRQSRLAAKADSADHNMQDFMDEALGDIEGWTE
ncbi:antitoxin MazE family protein [Pseudomonas sp. MYb185]|uniref:antitoxin MazE family protein n=1 Tax=Pseudomonas sp. MYb185 TaxID=1848729 RepID=UPI003532376B